jgi:spore coat polysaccharide biosynthesis protein SpsF
MKILALTQARVSSSRLPDKVLLHLGQASVLDLHLQRLKRSQRITDFCVATTNEPGAEKILAIGKKNGWSVFQGDLHDVLDRFYKAAKQMKADVVVRLTSDCPLIDGAVVDKVIEQFLQAKVDYASNCLFPTFPDGMDTEVFTFAALEKAWKEAELTSEREHVTPFIWKNSDIKGGNKFMALSVERKPSWSDFRVTLDQQEDYDVLKHLVKHVGEQGSMENYVEFLKGHPDIRKINSFIGTNEGYKKSVQKDKT